MGRSYYVPRSAKGESRILYIFTIKSFLTTLAGMFIGVIIYFIAKMFVEISVITMLIMIVPPGALGFAIGALKIPDVPLMGPLQKAGGENVMDILGRLITFPSRKKLYIYGIDRKIEKDKPKTTTTTNVKGLNLKIGGK